LRHNIEKRKFMAENEQDKFMRMLSIIYWRKGNMKTLLFWFLVVLLLSVVGCLPLTPSSPAPNQPPIAHIDSISASQIVPGEPVSFSGHGIDADGQIMAYSWRSTINGEISTSQSFETSSLSAGKHTVWFKVQDDRGDWSNEISVNIAVTPLGNRPPVIEVFEADPSTINMGKQSTLSWRVTGATTVRIDPDIGSVALVGNRAFYPARDTVYTLTASNIAGKVTATTEILISEVLSRTVEMNAIASESGHVGRDGRVGTETNVGDTINNTALQTFLSFDISMIPKDSKISSVFLDLTNGDVSGLPFALLGRLNVYSCYYTKLTSSDFSIGISPGAIYTTLGMFTVPVTSSPLVEEVQAAIDAGSSRFQVRLQFEKQNFNNRVADHVSFIEAKPTLIVKYED
jgi:hypothetical protein